MREIEKTCANCKWDFEDVDGEHCTNCIHNATENFEPQEQAKENVRLIDANELLYKIAKMSFDFGNDSDDTETIIEMVSEVIHNEPTAYNPEKVVEQLEKERHRELCGGWETLRIEKAIDIVRAGGKE